MILYGEMLTLPLAMSYNETSRRLSPLFFAFQVTDNLATLLGDIGRMTLVTRSLATKAGLTHLLTSSFMFREVVKREADAEAVLEVGSCSTCCGSVRHRTCTRDMSGASLTPRRAMCVWPRVADARLCGVEGSAARRRGGGGWAGAHHASSVQSLCVRQARGVTWREAMQV